MYPSLRTPNPFSTLIEAECNIDGFKFFVAQTLPGTVPATECRMGISASEESSIRRKGKKILSHTSRATRCDNPCSDQTLLGLEVDVIDAQPITNITIEIANRTGKLLGMGSLVVSFRSIHANLFQRVFRLQHQIFTGKGDDTFGTPPVQR